MACSPKLTLQTLAKIRLITEDPTKHFPKYGCTCTRPPEE